MRRIFVLLLLHLLGAVTHAESPPSILWAKTYFDGYLSSFQFAQETSNGDLMAAGYTTMTPQFGACLLDADGNLLWTSASDLYNQVGYWVEELSCGDFVITGQGRETSTSGVGLLLSRFDADGNEIWSRIYDLPGGSEVGYCATEIPDGGLAICGVIDPPTGNDQAWILRADSTGDTLWSDTWGAYTLNFASRILVVGDSLKVLTFGRIHPDSSRGPHILTYSMDGARTRETRIASLSNLTASDFCLASDGGCVITTEGTQARIAHVDWDGRLIWQSGIAGDGNSVAPTMDGGYIQAGDKEIIPCLLEPDDSWIIDGIDTEYYGLVTRFDQYGNQMWLDHVYDEDCMYLFSIHQLAQGGYIAAGTALGDGPMEFKALLIRYAPETGIGEGIQSPPCLSLDVPSPNPSSGSVSLSFDVPTSTYVDLAVYDLSGRCVAELVSETMSEGSHQTVWYPGDAPSGCYLVVLRTEDETLTRTCVRIL